MAKYLNIEDVNFSLEEELPIVLIKEHNLKFHIKGYHAYMNQWDPTIGEVLKTRLEPENEYAKFAVAVEKCGAVVGHISKGKTVRFAKTISFFLRANHIHYSRVEAIGKRVNLGDGQGLQIPCTLHFTGEAKYIDKLKDILPSLYNSL